MRTSRKLFIAAIGLYLASLISGWGLWALNGPALLAIFPCLLLTAFCLMLIAAINRYETEEGKS